jgi:F-type H+-transporting ATPase subunit b
VLIDWLTVAAQIVNFLILVGLMRRFLYGPLLHAIDAREERTAAKLAEADRKNQEADAKAAKIAAQMADLENRCAQTLADAHNAAEKERNELVAKAREDADAMETRWRDDVRREQTVFFDDIRREASTEVLAIARKALEDLASADIERSAVDTFLQKIGSVPEPELKELCARGVSVASPNGLPPDLQTRIREAVEAGVGGPVNLRFERAPEMRWGIELRGEGRRIGWNPETYFSSLEEKLRGVVNAQS